MSLNIELLNKVKECILNDPSQFDMDYFHMEDPESTCQTTSCIAGWAAYLNNPEWYNSASLNENFTYFLSFEGEYVLGLTSLQAGKLFYYHRWPKQFAEAYSKAKLENNKKQMAKVAADYIDYFIKNKDE
jgi:hypothetical protein